MIKIINNKFIPFRNTNVGQTLNFAFDGDSLYLKKSIPQLNS